MVYYTSKGGIVLHEITDMNALGFGITRENGAVVFVKGAVDGDICEIEPCGSGKNFRTALISELIAPSDKRCNVDCDAFGECGGCTLRHIDYEHELEVKRRSVMQAFRRVKIPVEVTDIRSASPVAYRNKAVFHRVGGRLGYYQGQSHDGVYPADGRCQLVPAEFDMIRRFAEEYKYAEVETLELRRGDGGAVCAALKLARGNIAELADALMCAFSQIVSLYEINAPGAYSLIRGERELHITLKDVRYTVTPSSFFQVNTACAAILVDTVREFADLRERERCADLYCGCGTFALSLAAASPKSRLIGIELSADAVDCAKRSAAWNGLENARFFAGDAAAFEERLAGIDAAIVDPPRAGLSKALVRQLIHITPKRIVYVSCNPETLARDCAALSGEFAIEKIRCIDMFPRTEHVETVVLLSRK